MLHDGIVLINLGGCGAWKTVLRVLQRNKQAITLMLLDQDCTEEHSSGYMKSETLLELGYPADFNTKQCYFVGTKEYEDAFDNEDLRHVLNSHYGKTDGSVWTIDELDALRNKEQGKFSEDLMREIISKSKPQYRQKAKKPDFAELLAVQCASENQIPEPIVQAFRHARDLAGCVLKG